MNPGGDLFDDYEALQRHKNELAAASGERLQALMKSRDMAEIWTLMGSPAAKADVNAQSWRFLQNHFEELAEGAREGKPPHPARAPRRALALSEAGGLQRSTGCMGRMGNRVRSTHMRCWRSTACSATRSG